MRILGMEKMSLVDYDGYVSATVFTGGCNFLCPFCHNSPLVIDHKSIEEIPTDSVLDYLKKRLGILDALCISGGEPTLQKDLANFMEQVKKLGYKIKLDTNGTNPEIIKFVHQNGLCDYFAMDIKNNLNDYAKIIGFDKFDTKNVQNSIEYFLSNDLDYEFRTTLIKEFHSKENIQNIAKEISGAKKYFLQKFKNGENCIDATSLNPIDNSTVLEFIEILTPYVPNVKTRGYDL